jgi:hypothetical protein
MGEDGRKVYSTQVNFVYSQHSFIINLNLSCITSNRNNRWNVYGVLYTVGKTKSALI